MPRKKAAKAKKIQIGDKALTYGKQVTDMIDSNELYQKRDFGALRLKLETDGYLFIRRVIPLDIVKKARTAMLQQAAKDQSIRVDDDNPLDNARMMRQFCCFLDLIFVASSSCVSYSLSLLHVGVLDIPQRHKRLLDGLRRRPLEHVVRPAGLVICA